MKITILLEKAANLTGGNRGNGGGRHDLCSLRFLLFSSPLLVSFANTAFATTHYVDVNSTDATPPYTNWPTAATNIQDAADAALAGDEVIVTNGVYSTGGRAVYGAINVLVIAQPISVRSVNGPQVTTIHGFGSYRCVFLANAASLSGFTLTNGIAQYGGGAYGGTLTNCILSRNQSRGIWILHYPGGFQYYPGYGGGAYACTLNSCTLISNSASLNLNNSYASHEYSSYGGAAASCTLNNCALLGNSAQADAGQFCCWVGYAEGGGAYSCTLNNCTLARNSTTVGRFDLPDDGYAWGGAACFCTLNNCTVVGNSAIARAKSDADAEAGVTYGTFNNCISFANFHDIEDAFGIDSGCEDCDSPGTLAGNNYYGDPLFVDTNGWAILHLQSNSPCINAGNDGYAPAGPDLDGNPRIIGGTVDIGAYEYQSLSLINFSVASNQAAFNITGQSNQVVIVEASTDLVDWSPLATNTLSGHPFSFSDPAPAAQPQRFYRAQTQ